MTTDHELKVLLTPPHPPFHSIDSRVLRAIFGPKKKEVTVDWRQLRDNELHKLQVYSSPNFIKISNQG